MPRDDKKLLQVEIGADYSKTDEEEEEIPPKTAPAVKTGQAASNQKPAAPTARASANDKATPPPPITSPPVTTAEISTPQAPIKEEPKPPTPAVKPAAPAIPSAAKTSAPTAKLVVEATLPEAKVAEIRPAPPSGKKKILIVDDDELLLDIHREVFKASDFEVFTAKNGKEAWEWLDKNKKSAPDVILTGIMMPRMNGLELIAKIKEAPELISIPVAIFSHRGLPEHEKKARELKVNDFIVQGITPPPEVVRRILLLLGVHNSFRVVFSTEKTDGAALFNLLNKERGDAGEKQCKLPDNKEANLEFEETPERGKFKIKLICD